MTEVKSIRNQRSTTRQSPFRLNMLRTTKSSIKQGPTESHKSLHQARTLNSFELTQMIPTYSISRLITDSQMIFQQINS